MLDAVYVVPALPLAGFLILTFLGKRIGDPKAGWLATLTVAGSFVATVVAFVGLLGREAEERSETLVAFSWLPVGELEVDVAFLVDPLSLTMALFVTGVGSLIHLYSIGYMRGDERYPKFFVYLNLFVFSMLVLVLADNFLLMFLGWEGVGACSYLLISFWFERERAAVAGKKAFVTNRIGDFGLMVAMFLLFATVGSLTYAEVLERFEGGDVARVTATAVALLLFLGAVGKSAQLPLYVWLPDAMEGPTPVSALIHAATMVTAGVYLMARSAPILEAAEPWALTLVAVVGALTALFAATIACAQDDIKKVLAYSTISQLGYMFLAVGSGAFVAALFHMVTHAFFKALLFLGAGSVIHGLHEQQDMKRMGALRRFMPVTAVTFIIGWLAIAGVPPFAGFWSKDEILLSAYDLGGAKGLALWAVGLVTALLTAYYMSRQVYLVFFGPERWRGTDPHAEGPTGTGGTEPEVATADSGHADDAHADDAHAGATPHESPWVMALPLVVLAGLTVVGGLLNAPVPGIDYAMEHWLEPVAGLAHEVDVASGTKVVLAAIATLAGIAGILIARPLWLRDRLPTNLEPAVLRRAWGVDALFAALVETPGRAFAAFAAYVFDRRVIDGAVNGVGTLVRVGGTGLRRVQTGYVRNYALGVAAGAALLLGYVVTRVGL